MHKVVNVILAAWLSVVSLASAADAAISISAGWILAAPPSSHAFAGYMTIDSVGADPVRVIGATSPAFSRISFHESTQAEDGMIGMRALPELRIAGGERLVLQPGGLHLMLMEPNAPLRLGDTVTVRLIVDGGEPSDVLLTIRSNP